MSFFGVELNAQVNRLILEIRLTLTKNKYLPNFRTIYKSFVKYDPDQSGWVTPIQFEKSLNENGIFFKKFELQVFEKAYSHEGTINWFAFISTLKEQLNPTRQKILDAIWKYLDAKNEGKISITLLNQKFNASDFKQFKLGHKSKDTILKQFLNLVPITADGFVTYQEFINFYTDTSINIPSDDTFASFVSSQWGYKYTPEKTTTLQEIKAALKAIRFKLLQRTNNTHEEFILRKIFNQYDRSKSGRLEQEDLIAMLVKLEIPTQPRLIAPILARLSQQNNGFVDFQDFQQFVFFDAYHI